MQGQWQEHYLLGTSVRCADGAGSSISLVSRNLMYFKKHLNVNRYSFTNFQKKKS